MLIQGLDAEAYKRGGMPGVTKGNLRRMKSGGKVGRAIDPKRKFVGLLMTQANQSPDKAGLGSGVYDKFRGALYRSFFNEVN